MMDFQQYRALDIGGEEGKKGYDRGISLLEKFKTGWARLLDNDRILLS